MKSMKLPCLAFIAGVYAFCFAFSAQAGWPDRPLRFVVPYAAGGLNDHSARIAAKWLTQKLGENVIVENKTGASGAIAGEYVARSRPDGYTFFFSAAPALTSVPHIRNVPYNTFKSFEPVSITDESYAAFAVNPSLLPVKTFSQLVSYAKSHSKRLAFATGGVGVTGHLAMELLLKKAGIKMTHVPYHGSAPAVLAVLSGQVPVYSGTLSDVLKHYEAGSLRIIGVSSAERLSVIPKVPTIAEQGYPDYKVETWDGLLAPAKTPERIVSKIAQALEAACKNPEIRAEYAKLTVEPVCSTPMQMAHRLHSDFALWGEAVKAAGIEKQ